MRTDRPPTHGRDAAWAKAIDERRAARRESHDARRELVKQDRKAGARLCKAAKAAREAAMAAVPEGALEAEQTGGED